MALTLLVSLFRATEKSSMGTEPWVPSLLRSSPGLSVQSQDVKAMSPCLNRLHQHALSFSDWTCFTVASVVLSAKYEIDHKVQTNPCVALL